MQSFSKMGFLCKPHRHVDGDVAGTPTSTPFRSWRSLQQVVLIGFATFLLEAVLLAFTWPLPCDRAHSTGEDPHAWPGNVQSISRKTMRYSLKRMQSHSCGERRTERKPQQRCGKNSQVHAHVCVLHIYLELSQIFSFFT